MKSLIEFVLGSAVEQLGRWGLREVEVVLEAFMRGRLWVVRAPRTLNGLLAQGWPV